LTKRLTIIEDLKSLFSFITITEAVNICRGPKDNKYLELANSSNASCLVTGDKDLLILNPFENIPIMTAADFIRQF
jgi:uncharacterized protein